MDVNKLEEEVLLTLSFISPMHMNSILYDLDDEVLYEHKDFKLEDLHTLLNSLERRNLVKKIKKEDEVYWQKTMPSERRSLKNKLLKLFHLK